MTDSALYRSTDGGDSWQLTSQQPQSIFLHTIFGHMGSIFIGTRGDGVFRSQDEGETWEELSTGLAGDARSIQALTVRGDSLFAGTNGSGVYVLNLQNPVQWLSFNNGLFQYGTASIATSGSMRIAGIGSYVFTSESNEAAWTETYINPEFLPISLKIFPMDQYIFVGTQNGIYRGNADATGWEKTDITQFPDRDINSFTSYENRIFAGLIFGSEHFLFSSDNYGASWDIRAHEFAFLFDMIISYGRLWAARDDGLWYIDMDVWTGTGEDRDPLPRTYELGQNYPNPFNPATTIQLCLPQDSDTKLKIYNILGSEVAVLVDEYLPVGVHTIFWNAEGFPSGVYFYSLHSADVTLTRKMVLAR